MTEDLDGGRNRVVELIEAAVFAGAYSLLAKDLPDAARGLEKLRLKWSTKVGALCDEIVAGAAAEAAPHQ